MVARKKLDKINFFILLLEGLYIPWKHRSDYAHLCTKGSLIFRQLDIEGRALPFFALDPDTTTMGLDDLFTDEEPET